VAKLNSAEQVARLLALVPYLTTRGGYADLADTAALFGVSAKQLRREIALLSLIGDESRGPGNLIDVDLDGLDEGDIFLSNADFLARPMRFSAAEARSVTLALEAMKAWTTDTAAIEGALAKLRQAQREAVEVPVVLDTHPTEILAALTKAIEADEVVRLNYGNQARITPVVEPKQIVNSGRYSYLQAFNVELDDWRTYRLDRIETVTPTGQAAQARPEPPQLEGWLERAAGAATVTLTVSPEAAWIAEYWPVLATTETADGLQVELLVADQAWLTAQLLLLGSQVRQVNPPAAATPAKQAAAEALAQYRELVG
jgi:proteasome accessory factor C